MKHKLLSFFYLYTLLFAVPWKIAAADTNHNMGTITIYVDEGKTFYRDYSYIPSAYYVNADSWFLRHKTGNSWIDKQEFDDVKILSKSSESCTIVGLASNNDPYGLSTTELHCKGTRQSIGDYEEMVWTIDVKSYGSLSVNASPAGGTVSEGTSVTLTAKSNGSTVSGCDIYYTLDGTVPTKSSTKYTSSGVTINKSGWLTAKAYKTGYESRSYNEWYFTVKEKVLSDGDVFVGETSDGVEMKFQVISSTQKTCRVYGEFNSPTIDESVTKVTIPSNIRGYKVTEIGKSAFRNCKSLVDIYIPEGVTKIGNEAFIYCSSLSSIELPNSVEIIDSYAFDVCSSLKSVKFSSSLKDIGIAAFYNCPSISEITIPKSVETIYNSAFGFCSGLKSIKVEAGNSIFDSREDCNAIIRTEDNVLLVGCQATIIPNTVTSINEEAFHGQSSLTEITIPRNIQEIGYMAFHDCTSLVKVTSEIQEPYDISTYIFTYRSSEKAYEQLPATLYVPYGTKTKYQSSKGWKDFKKIVELEQTGIAIDASNFPDKAFRNWLLSQDYGKDGVLTDDEIKNVTSIDVFSEGISSLKGIEFFTALTHLSCGLNQLTTLDVSKNTALSYLSCYYNQLTTLDVSKNTALTNLYCSSNQLTALDVSKNTALTNLDCGANQLTTLDVSKNTALETLACGDNQLTTLDVSKNTALTNLYCYSNQLTTLDVSKNTALKNLHCSYNQLTALDVLNNTALESLDCSHNQLTALDVLNNTALESLDCVHNQLTILDVSKNTELTRLVCNNNQLTALNVSKNAALTSLYCYNNQLTALDVSRNTKLTYLSCYSNQLKILDVSKNTALTYLSCYTNKIKGTATDNLIKGLPVNTTNNVHRFYFIDPTNESEGNIGTKAQMDAAKAKGWTPYYYNGTKWLEYEGSDDPQKKGTEEDPFTPAEANEYGSTLAKNEQSEEDYYIRGMVVSIKEQFGTKYGNATFYISADGTEKDQFYIYRALYLDNTKYAGQDLLLREGDDVVVCGKITNYQGTLPETVQNQAYVVSINGVTTGIRDIAADAVKNAPIYNLSGQKLTAPKKGLNIIGGKKVVVK